MRWTLDGTGTVVRATADALGDVCGGGLVVGAAVQPARTTATDTVHTRPAPRIRTP
jgi:hypothetical protein